MPVQLRRHDVTLRSGNLVLRPMTEADWSLLYRWNNDPEVLYYAEGDDISSRTLEDVQCIYRSVSQQAYYFIIELDGRPIGECQLQQMNLPRILREHSGQDVRRIDITIGEKTFWGQGIGTRALRLLTQFGFEREGTDAIYGCDVADYNARSRRAFERAGFRLCHRVPQPPGDKAHEKVDLILTREQWGEQRGLEAPNQQAGNACRRMPQR
ncbi:MAG: GNAT family N-acetyltransferase [Chloroflexi bacterium]|nr:GNAT family N-acetyltransferase [Chloroflexota bacterium]